MKRSAWRATQQPWRLRLGRALGRTRLGAALRGPVRALRLLRDRATRCARRQLKESPLPIKRRAVRNVVLVSHCDFTGNSALHVYSIASELYRRGMSPTVVIPANASTVADVGSPSFPVLTYRDVRKGRLGREVDLVHAFTPRERVRRLTLDLVHEHRCPYIVHLEDNEEAVLDRSSHPLHAKRFAEAAAGVTVVVERLLELKPGDIPGAVVWPGFDEAVLSPLRPRDEVRSQLGLLPGQLVLVYNGNLHEANFDEVRELYLAVSLLRRGGHRAVLVKTGWNFVHRSRLPDLGDGLIDLGWVARKHVPELLATADVLVQPGRPDSFNDYRFPSKLPEFLASGRPVVLPRTNIGLHLEDGAEALLLERGDAEEIREKVALLAENQKLRARLGERGQAFALRRLRWPRSVDRIVELYRRAQPEPK